MAAPRVTRVAAGVPRPAPAPARLFAALPIGAEHDTDNPFVFGGKKLRAGHLVPVCLAGRVE